MLNSNWIDLELDWLVIVVKDLYFMWTVYQIFNWWLFWWELIWIL